MSEFLSEQLPSPLELRAGLLDMFRRERRHPMTEIRMAVRL